MPIEVLEKLLDTREYSSVRDEIVDALGPLYLKMVEQGYLTSEDLEKRLNSEWGTDARHAILNVLSFVYPRMIEEKNFSPEGFMRYSLWIKENFPYEEEIFESFWDSSDPVRFVEQIKREAHQVIENGFDYNDPKKLWFAYVAVRSSGIVLTRDEFEERIGELIKFDKKNPGYWQMLFNKTKGLGVLNVSATEYENKVVEDVDGEVFDAHLYKLLGIQAEVDSFNWLLENFEGDKKLKLSNIYWNFKRNEAIREGIITDKDRFSIPFPSEMVMREELLSKKKEFYNTVFKITYDKYIGEHSERCLVLMRNLIIAESLLDEGLVRQLQSEQIDEKIEAFKSFYEDYKRHLPMAAIGVKVESIKGLTESFEQLSADVYEEIAKVKVIKVKGGEGYSLVPQGFLGVFRGRAGIMDCSFDMDRDKGYAFTRAMHEDTMYYFVYKGKELKGYVGLMKGETKDGKKVLVVDTIQSASLDGEELLTNLLKGLNELAGNLGLEGVVLPRDLDGAFNFDNDKTVKKLPVYVNGTKVKVHPQHMDSWGKFTAMFGEDQYNSIEDEKFVLLKFDTAMHTTIPMHQMEESSTGGIDLTPANMHLQTQNNGGEIKFHIDPAMLAQLRNAPGFVPVIISIKPMTDLKGFLGITTAV